MTAATFILIPKQPQDPVAAAEALKFFAWAYAKGDKMAEELDYVPMPKKVVAEIEKVWASEIRLISLDQSRSAATVPSISLASQLDDGIALNRPIGGCASTSASSVNQLSCPYACARGVRSTSAILFREFRRLTRSAGQPARAAWAALRLPTDVAVSFSRLRVRGERWSDRRGAGGDVRLAARAQRGSASYGVIANSSAGAFLL